MQGVTTSTSRRMTPSLLSALLRSLQQICKANNLTQYGLLFLILGPIRAVLQSMISFTWKNVHSFVMESIIRTFIGKAVFNDKDRAFHWMTLFLNTQAKNENSSRVLHVRSIKPNILLQPTIEPRTLSTSSFLDRLWSIKPRFNTKASSAIEDLTEKTTLHDETISKKTNYFFVPSVAGTRHFVFEKTHFWVSSKQRTRNEVVEKTMEISYASFTDEPLCKLLDHVYDAYQKEAKTGVALVQMTSDGRWERPKVTSRRSIESIHLEEKMSILEDAKCYFSEEHRNSRKEKSIPLRRGYLFHGPPGTGKSTMCHVLASELNVPMYVLKVNCRYMDDSALQQRMNDIPDRSIVLIEDIDAAFKKRTGGPDSNHVTFSGLLNSLDGIGAAEGRLLCFTTNHIERLDPALIRESRIDKKIAFTNATQDQARDLFLRMFMPTETPADEEVQRQADTFASLIPPSQFSLSALQCHLLQYEGDYAGAVEGTAAWVEKKEACKK